MNIGCIFAGVSKVLYAHGYFGAFPQPSAGKVGVYMYIYGRDENVIFIFVMIGVCLFKYCVGVFSPLVVASRFKSCA